MAAGKVMPSDLLAQTAVTHAMLDVQVVQSLGPRHLRHVRLRLPAGSTVAEALAMTQWFDPAAPDAWPRDLQAGIWGRKVALNHGLQTGDRLEVYRPLKIDPKEARRQRYAAHLASASRISGQKRYKRSVTL